MPKVHRPLTHQERYERRQKMADLVKSGKTLDAVARKFRVTTVTVRNACQEFGVSPKQAPTVKKQFRSSSAGR